MSPASSKHGGCSMRPVGRFAWTAAFAALLAPGPVSAAKRAPVPGRSTTIALFAKDSRLVVVNRETDSVSVLAVRRRGRDVAEKLAEVLVGRDPRCVAIGRND